MNDIDSFASRLNKALDVAGFPPKNKGRIQLLAEMVSLTHRGASKWINGETKPPAKKYASLAEKLNVHEEWLRAGEGPMINGVSEILKSEDVFSQSKTKVPVIAIEEWYSPKKNILKTVECNLPSQGNLFAIQLETEVMSPRFPKGSTVILDDVKPPEDGDFIFLTHQNYPVPIFRQLLIMGGVAYLNAHNPKFDRLILSNEDKIHGVMVQAILTFI